MSDTIPKRRKPLIERPGGGFIIMLLILGGGMVIGAILAKVRPPSPSTRPTEAPAQTRPSTDRSTFKIGDQIELTLSDAAAPGSQKTSVYTVDERGTIPIPLLGPLDVRGRTAATLERAIAQAYYDKNLIENMQVRILRVNAQPAATAPAR